RIPPSLARQQEGGAVTSAATLIEELSGAGIAVSRIGGQLVLDGPADRVTDALIEKVRAWQSDILNALKEWDLADWQAFFDEWAGIAQYEGCCSRQEAEAIAFDNCVHHWLVMNPPDACSQQTCAYCGYARGEIGRDCIPVLRGNDGHLWLHHGCIDRFHAA